MPRSFPDKNLTARLMPLLVPLFTAAVFLPALKNGFVNWDDIYNLVENTKYRGLGPEQLKWMFTSFRLGPYTPLTSMSFGLDYLVWGGVDAFGYHLTSVLLHSFNALLFYFLCVKLLSLAFRPPPGGAEPGTEVPLAAGFAALLFAVHPLRVESAVWLSGRHDVLCCSFCLLAVLLYIQPRSPGGEAAPFWRRHLLPPAAFLLALLAKGMAVSIPVLLVVLDIYPLRRLPGDPRRWFLPEYRRTWLEKIPFFALAAAFGALGYVCQEKAGALTSYQAFGFGARAAQILFSLFFYIKKTLVPLDLSPLYRLPDGFGLLSPQAVLAGLVVAAVTAAAVVLRRRRPAVAAVWACYLAVLAPVIGIVKINTQAAADRYTYLACLGFAALAGAGLLACRRAAGPRLRALCLVLACSVIAALAALTWRQEGVWRDSETLWTRALALNPELDFAHNNLGLVLAAQGKLEAAERHYREALRLNPGFAEAHNNLTGILVARGRLDEAAAHNSGGARLNSAYNLGVIAAAQGRPDAAAAYYRAALKINPGFAEAHGNLGSILAGQGKPAEAEAHYRAALRVNPEFTVAHYNLAGLLAARGEPAAAAAEYREALRLGPDLAEAHNNLAGLLAAQGRRDEAAGHYREALRANPSFTLAYYNFAGLLAAQGKFGEAEKKYLEALRLSPGLAEAHYNLSRVLAAQGKTGQAEKHYRLALQFNPALGRR